MKKISPLIHHRSSVSLPARAYRKICAARLVFSRNGFFFSDQEIYRWLLKFYLSHWRGDGVKTNGLRRYNVRGKAYEIHPLYINQMLHAAIWQRALHSGESVSRMLDVAIRIYLPRLLEQILGTPRWSKISERNKLFWAARFRRRRHVYQDVFINYYCKTSHNYRGMLEYSQKVCMIPKTGLTPAQIWHLLQNAA